MKHLIIRAAFVLLMTGSGALPASRDNDARPGYESVKVEIEAQRAKWLGLAPRDYQYRLQYACFCARSDLLIAVVNGEIAVTKSMSEGGVSHETVPPNGDDVLSITGIFRQSGGMG